LFDEDQAKYDGITAFPCWQGTADGSKTDLNGEFDLEVGEGVARKMISFGSGEHDWESTAIIQGISTMESQDVAELIVAR
jgi:hypothetical protein